MSLTQAQLAKINQGQFLRMWSLHRSLGELNSLARALSMGGDIMQVAQAYQNTIAIVGVWLNVGVGESPTPGSYLGHSGTDYFTDVVNIACQRIRDNISSLAPIDATPGDICAISGVRAFYDSIFNKIYVCDDTFVVNTDELGRILVHEYFHAIGLVHGSQNPQINIDSCFYSPTTESKLDNPYCMTGLVEHIAYGYVWWQS